MIKTRFSPSPTGQLHLGNARAALFSNLYSVNQNGSFLLRIEDTDAVRSDSKFTKMLQNDLHWLGINWQEGPEVDGPNGPYWQSQRREIYDAHYAKLIAEELAYPCFCTDQELALNRKLQLSRGHAPRYPGTCRKLTAAEVATRISNGSQPALRFHVPLEQVLQYPDLVKGAQVFKSNDIGDFIIRRADGSASFLFCNAIDDSLMGVTHVLRGDDHLTNTPRQLLILKALKMREPNYGHLSLITGDDGSRLSKRHGSFSLHDLVTEGFLSQAVLNYLARLSHAYESQNLLSFTELAQHFNLEKLSKAPAKFDKHQLQHWQKEAVMALSAADTLQWIKPAVTISIPTEHEALFADIMKKNILFPSDAEVWAQIFFAENLDFTAEQITLFNKAGAEFFVTAQSLVEKNGVDIKTLCEELKNKLGVSGKNLFMPVRLALTGAEHGPELNHIAVLLGPEKIRARFAKALAAVGI
jgi:glutamyl-tRNA synthetase